MKFLARANMFIAVCIGDIVREMIGAVCEREQAMCECECVCGVENLTEWNIRYTYRRINAHSNSQFVFGKRLKNNNKWNISNRRWVYGSRSRHSRRGSHAIFVCGIPTNLFNLKKNSSQKEICGGMLFLFVQLQCVHDNIKNQNMVNGCQRPIESEAHKNAKNFKTDYLTADGKINSNSAKKKQYKVGERLTNRCFISRWCSHVFKFSLNRRTSNEALRMPNWVIFSAVRQSVTKMSEKCAANGWLRGRKCNQYG